MPRAPGRGNCSTPGVPEPSPLGAAKGATQARACGDLARVRDPRDPRDPRATSTVRSGPVRSGHGRPAAAADPGAPGLRPDVRTGPALPEPAPGARPAAPVMGRLRHFRSTGRRLPERGEVAGVGPGPKLILPVHIAAALSRDQPLRLPPPRPRGARLHPVPRVRPRPCLGSHQPDLLCARRGRDDVPLGAGPRGARGRAVPDVLARRGARPGPGPRVHALRLHRPTGGAAGLPGGRRCGAAGSSDRDGDRRGRGLLQRHLPAAAARGDPDAARTHRRLQWHRGRAAALGDAEPLPQQFRVRAADPKVFTLGARDPGDVRESHPGREPRLRPLPGSGEADVVAAVQRLEPRGAAGLQPRRDREPHDHIGRRPGGAGGGAGGAGDAAAVPETPESEAVSCDPAGEGSGARGGNRGGRVGVGARGPRSDTRDGGLRHRPYRLSVTGAIKTPGDSEKKKKTLSLSVICQSLASGWVLPAGAASHRGRGGTSGASRQSPRPEVPPPPGAVK